MNNAKHTRGPWKAERCTASEIEIGAETPAGHLSVAWVHLGDKPTKLMVDDGWADALLLASAPELLEAARGLLQLIGRGAGGPFEPRVDGTYNERVEALFQAVAKAEAPRG